MLYIVHETWNTCMFTVIHAHFIYLHVHITIAHWHWELFSPPSSAGGYYNKAALRPTTILLWPMNHKSHPFPVEGIKSIGLNFNKGVVWTIILNFMRYSSTGGWPLFCALLFYSCSCSGSTDVWQYLSKINISTRTAAKARKLRGGGGGDESRQSNPPFNQNVSIFPSQILFAKLHFLIA